MKLAESITQIYKQLFTALNEIESIETLMSAIHETFKLVYDELPLLIPYEISLVETEALRYSEFYQSGPELSRHAIEIRGIEYCEYIWRDTGEWVLADEYYNAEAIVQVICRAELFTQVPENVNDLMLLLRWRRWQFASQQLPNFGGLKPKDSLEVLSWDSNNLLVGTNIDNIEVVSRDEWDKLLARETGSDL